MRKIIVNRITEHLAIKARREGKNRFTQEDLVAGTGLTRKTISLHLRNQIDRYDLESVDAWCQFLGIGPEDFFTYMYVNDSEDTDTEVKPSLLATA